MAARLSVGLFRVGKYEIQVPKQMTAVKTIRELSPSFIGLRLGNKRKLSMCFAVEENESPVAAAEAEESSRELERKIIESFTVAGGNRAEERMARKKTERFTYLVAAVMSSFGITSMAVFAVYSRFAWQMEVFFLHAYVELILCIFRYAFSTLKRICKMYTGRRGSSLRDACHIFTCFRGCSE